MIATSTKFVIKEFLKKLGSKDSWRVDWLNVLPPNSTTELHQVAVFLSPLRTQTNSFLNSSSAVDSSRQKCVVVGVGLMPILHVGAVFKGGELIENTFPQPKTVSIRECIDPSVSKYLKLNTKIPSGQTDHQSRPLLYPSEFSIGKVAWQHTQGSQLLTLPDINGIDPFFLTIPCFEVLRFFFCTSSLLASELFSSSWANLIWLEGCSTEQMPTSVTIGLETVRGLRHTDAIYLAFALTSEDTANALNEVQASLKSLASGQELRCPFPFKEPTQISAEVVEIESNTFLKKRYFVTRLLRCKRPIPFQTYIANPKFNPTQGQNHDDMNLLPTPFSQSNDPTATTRSGPGHVQRVSNADEMREKGFTSDDLGSPGNFYEHLELKIDDSRFDGLKDIKREKFVKLTQKHRNEGTQNSGPPTKVNQASTATPGQSNNPVMPAHILDEESVNDPLLKQLLDSAIPLRSMGYKVETLPLQKIHPIGKCSHRSWTNVWRSSTEVDGHQGLHRRRLALLSVQTNNCQLIIADIERRSFLTTEESFAMAGFQLPPHCNDQSFAEALAQQVSLCSGWPSQSTDGLTNSAHWLTMKKMPHNKNETVGDLARRIEKSLIRPLTLADDCVE